MKIKEILKDITIVGIALVVITFIFLSAVLKESYKYCPPSTEEVAQMNFIERWLYKPFME